jgi:hypothetical protein
LRSRRSISESCWSTSDRLRRDSVSNMSLDLQLQAGLFTGQQDGLLV